MTRDLEQQAADLALGPLDRRHAPRSPPGRDAARHQGRGLRHPGAARGAERGAAVRLEDRGHQQGGAGAHRRGWAAGRAAAARAGVRGRQHECPLAPTTCASPKRSSRFGWGGPWRRARRLIPWPRCWPRWRACTRRSRSRTRASTTSPRSGAPQLIADNACAHYFVLGSPAAVDWRRDRSGGAPRDRRGRGRRPPRRHRRQRARRSANGADLAGERALGAGAHAGGRRSRDHRHVSGAAGDSARRPLAMDFGPLGRVEARLGEPLIASSRTSPAWGAAARATTSTCRFTVGASSAPAARAAWGGLVRRRIRTSSRPDRWARRPDSTPRWQRSRSCCEARQRPLVYLAPGLVVRGTAARRRRWPTRVRRSLDNVSSSTVFHSVLAGQEIGRATATLGEVRNRADTVVLWDVDAARYPRLAERYAIRARSVSTCRTAGADGA